MGIDNAKALERSTKLAKLITIDGMNHILKMVSGNLQEQLSSYSDSSLPISEELVDEISDFIKSVEKK